MIDAETAARFKALFSGLETSHGTGLGGWVHQPPTIEKFVKHLNGEGDGLGIAPLRDDATVSFAAIDLDEPNFEAAIELEGFLPGSAFIERSRSGNAHIFAFFEEPIEAWVPRGIMREACAALGKRSVEVFPKQDSLRLGMVGNYINLPYYGYERPILNTDVVVADPAKVKPGHQWWEYNVHDFLDLAEASLNNGTEWRKRAHWLGIPSPKERQAEGREFGTSSILHKCAEHVLEHREDNPVVEGHRAVVYFCLSKMFANCNQYSTDESLALLALINDASPDPISEGELRRIYFNAERGQFTSTGCDDPLFASYAHPDCPIANQGT